MSKTWIVVADRGRARLMVYGGRHALPQEFEDLIAPEARLSGKESAADRGRLHSDRDPSGTSVHRLQPRTSPTEKASNEFAATVATRLQTAVDAGELTRLILMAPPRFLGHLRSALPSRIRDLIVNEVGKDLTQSTLSVIQEHL